LIEDSSDWSSIFVVIRYLVRISSSHSQDSSSNQNRIVQEDLTQSLLPSPTPSTNIKEKVTLHVMKQNLGKIIRHINLKAVFALSTIGALSWPPRVSLGRLLPHARGLKFESFCGGFPSRWESVGFFPIDASIRGWHGLPSGHAAVPIVTLIVGGNLLRGLKGSGISLPHVFGIVAFAVPPAMNTGMIL
ncbi:hypothetical protein Tco_1536384, partial [Tanacetum coccineum]